MLSVPSDSTRVQIRQIVYLCIDTQLGPEAGGRGRAQWPACGDRRRRATASSLPWGSVSGPATGGRIGEWDPLSESCGSSNDGRGRGLGRAYSPRARCTAAPAPPAFCASGRVPSLTGLGHVLVRAPRRCVVARRARTGRLLTPRVLAFRNPVWYERYQCWRCLNRQPCSIGRSTRANPSAAHAQ